MGLGLRGLDYSLWRRRLWWVVHVHHHVVHVWLLRGGGRGLGVVVAASMRVQRRHGVGQKHAEVDVVPPGAEGTGVVTGFKHCLGNRNSKDIVVYYRHIISYIYSIIVLKKKHNYTIHTLHNNDRKRSIMHYQR